MYVVTHTLCHALISRSGIEIHHLYGTTIIPNAKADEYLSLVQLYCIVKFKRRQFRF